MSSLNVEILNPKAKKLLQDLEDMNLISIKKPGENPFLSVVRRIRSKRAEISLDDITKEIETARAKR